MMSDEARIIRSQVDWAQRHGIDFDRSNVRATREDNLFIPLRPETEAEFSRGAGDELGRPDSPGSMASLRSTAALAVNVFDPWRGTDLGPLTELIAADRWADQRVPGGPGGDFYWTKIAYLGREYIQLALSQYHQNRIDQNQLAEYLDSKPRHVGTLEEYFSRGDT